MWRLLLGTMGVKSLVQGLNAAATAGFEPRTVWFEVRRRNRLATAPLPITVPVWKETASTVPYWVYRFSQNSVCPLTSKKSFIRTLRTAFESWSCPCTSRTHYTEAEHYQAPDCKTLRRLRSVLPPWIALWNSLRMHILFILKGHLRAPPFW